ncbi:MAG TPA: TolC family protein [Polyangiaceae bacterium]|nr:TolC family protein [Polyangiaceae bacterium]
MAYARAALGVFLCVFGFVAQARAEDLTWAQVKDRASKRSPSAVEGKQVVRAARAEAEGAGRWPRENPVLTGSVETGAPFGHSHDLGVSVGIEQAIDVAGVAAASGRAAGAQVTAAEKEAAVLRQDALADAANAFIDLDRAQRSLSIWIELDAMFRSIAAGTTRAAEAGERSELDAILAEADSADASADLAQAKIDLAAAQARLAVLIGAADPASLRVTGAAETPEPDSRTVAELTAVAARRQPELSLWRARLAEAEARRSFTGRAVVPQPTVGVGFRWDRSELGRESLLGAPGGLLGIRDTGQHVEVTLSISLPFFDRNQANRARALADASTAREGADIADRALKSDIMRAKAAVDASWAALGRYQAILPKLAKAQGLLEKGFAAGQIGLFDTLTGAERVARARVRAIEARSAYLKARAELARALGEEP